MGSEKYERMKERPFADKQRQLALTFKPLRAHGVKMMLSLLMIHRLFYLSQSEKVKIEFAHLRP